MPHRPSITIPEPCHENWAQMSPAAQGRHCAACDKVVVDFTRMTDTEVVNWLQRQQAGQTCGRFATQQLNRPLLVPPAPAPRWQKWVAATAAAVGLHVAMPTSAQAQRTTPTEQRLITLGIVAVPRRVEPLALNLPLRGVRGIVEDSAPREPLPGVTVIIAGTTTGVSTNAEGEFKLELPSGFDKADSVELEFSAIGYISQRRTFDSSELDTLRVALAPESRMLSGEVVIVGGYNVAPWYSPRGLWQRATRIFRQP
ncbi:carboxypeptidase-like regulatory domain-containing protein [Hymenobacter sp. HD11105]